MKYSDIQRTICCALKLKKTYPVISFKIEHLFDRFGVPFVDHPHLKFFEEGAQSFEKAVDAYHRYALSIAKTQEGAWLQNFGIYEKRIPFWTTPWEKNRKVYEKYRLTRDYAKRYVHSLISTRATLVINQYDPSRYGHITGQMLVKDTHEKRAIIWNGHRRALSLIHLGHSEIPVEISGGNRWKLFESPCVIRESELSQWSNVTNKQYTPQEAQLFFNTFFAPTQIGKPSK